MPSPRFPFAVALLLVACAASACAQAPPPPPGEIPAAAAADPAAARLAFARAALAAEGVADPLPQPGPVRVTFERAGVHAAQRGRNVVRVLAGVVRVVNTDDARPARVGPGVSLRAGNAVIKPNAVPDDVSTRSSYLSGEAADWVEPREVAPGAAAEFPASFFDLPGAPDALPDPLVLVVPYVVGPKAAGEGPDGESFAVEFDVAAYHRGLAALTGRRVGPADALAVLAVTGELTALGRYAALDRLRDLGAAGVRRGLLTWETARLGPPDARGDATLVPAVPPLPDPPEATNRFDPGRTAGSARTRFRQDDDPASRAGLAEFHLAVDPTGAVGPGGEVDGALAAAIAADRNAARRLSRAAGAAPGVAGPAGDFGRMRDYPVDAAAAALRTALRTLAPADARRQIVAGDPLVRPGAVRYAGPNLPPADLPLLIALTADADQKLRSAAAAALGAFDSDAARAALAGLTRGDDAGLAADAARALATARFPGGPAALAAVVANHSDDLPGTVFAVLAEYPDPGWRDTLVALAADPEAPARTAALRVLAKADDPAAPGLLADAVAGEGPAAATAFGFLAGSADPAAAALAADYALRAVAATGPENPPAGDVLAYLARARPAAAAGPLWDLFARSEPGERGDLIALLARLVPGDSDGTGTGALTRAELGGRLADRWDKLAGDERPAALAAVADLAPARVAGPAGDALRGGDESLEDAALAALRAAGTPAGEVAGLLSDAFAAAPDQDAAVRIGRELAGRATPEARAALLDRRWSDVKHVAEIAGAFTAQMHDFGPGRAFFDRAGDVSGADLDGDGFPDGGPARYEASLRFLDIGLRLDPGAASGWSTRAFARGQAGALEEAREDYRAALALDPYDNLALTGLAILEIELGGDLDAAFARAEEGLKKYPEDALFAYNLACVYGVAAKARVRESGVSDPAKDPAAVRYLEKARGHLARSYRLSPEGDGFRSPVSRDHTAKDPDLELLRGDPTFERIVAGTLPADPAKGEG